ncbi:MAG: polysaccharide biosynthesis C-terminal domain-containing protein, partial [Methanobacterium sp.]|nr:polysaccharide biosynthesis C-terminal domain-containing protein [Methanobacterium sp.]
VMVGNEAVGLYNAAYRLVLVFLFVPSVLNTAIFPAMSQFYINSKESLNVAYKKYFNYMAIIGIPLGIGTTLLADKIILLIYGAEFSNAVIALQILVWSAVIIFMSGAFARLLEASDKQMAITKIAAICAVFNIILNLIVIPKYGYVGASVITVLTEFLAFLFGLKIVGAMNYDQIPIKPKLLIKIAIASLVMSICIILLINWNLIFLIILSIILYFVTLVILKGFDKEDITLIRNILNK